VRPLVRVALYARVSTDDQAKEGFSLQAQKDRLEAYCEAQGWEVAGYYIDDGHSGRSARRPAYQRMIEERDQWDTILVMKMDRIHRNSKNFMIMMEKLEHWGKRFASMQESLDTSTAVGRFVVDIIQRIAQLESEQIGERTYMGMRQKAESGGGILGFEPPYGYRLEHGVLMLNPEESQVVKDIFDSYLNGSTMEMISIRLNNDLILTRKNNGWTVYSVSRILHNPIYTGYVRWDGLLIEDHHSPIVDVKKFNQVQRLIASKIRNPKYRKYFQIKSNSPGSPILAEMEMI
jgi:site-specific DNA recombinase